MPGSGSPCSTPAISTAGSASGPDDTQRRFADADASAWAARASTLADSVASGVRVRIGAAIHSVRAVDPRGHGDGGRWAADREVPFHAHVSEQPAENEQCQAAYGRTPTEVLSDSGALGDRFTAVHATHLTAADIARLGASSCWCCFCPTTERDLADGIGPSTVLARRRSPPDSRQRLPRRHRPARGGPRRRTRRAVRPGRPRSSRCGRPAGMATEHGHASLGYPDAGSIRVGASPT